MPIRSAVVCSEAGVAAVEAEPVADDLALEVGQPVHGLTDQVEGHAPRPRRPRSRDWSVETRSPRVAVESVAAGWSRLATTRAAWTGPRASAAVVLVASSSSASVGGRCSWWVSSHMGGVHLLVALGHLHGEADGAPVLLDGPLEGLTDPPGGVGGEPEAPLPVELVDGPHEAEGALLDQVGQVHAAVLVATGPVDDQAEVGGHHLPAGGVVPGGDPLGQLGLGVVVGQRVVVEVTQEQAQAVGVRPPVAVGGRLGRGRRGTRPGRR